MVSGILNDFQLFHFLKTESSLIYEYNVINIYYWQWMKLSYNTICVFDNLSE